MFACIVKPPAILDYGIGHFLHFILSINALNIIFKTIKF